MILSASGPEIGLATGSRSWPPP